MFLLRRGPSSLLLSLLICVPVLNHAQQSNLRTRPGRALPAFIEAHSITGSPSPEAAPAAVHRQWSLNRRTTFVEEGRRTDAAGYTRTAYAQVFNGYPVDGARLTVVGREGSVTRIASDVFKITSRTASSSLSEDAARGAALAAVGAEKYLWQEDASTLHSAYATAAVAPVGHLCWAPVGGDVRAAPDWRLCYRFDVYATRPRSRHWVYVDAATGEVVWKRSRIAEGASVGTGVTLYSGNRTMITDSISPTLFHLLDTTRGGGIHTLDLNEGTNPAFAVEFSDVDNFWNTSTDLNKAANDAHWGAEVVYDYYDTAHNWQSYNGAGSPLISYVHVDVDYVNAFWDGTAMYYGDGNGTSYNPLTSMDVAGHEITHGVTEHTAGLIYSYESGALNESFSDIFGNTIERLAKPTDWSWRVGEEIGTSSSAYFRSMSNPGAKGDPDTYLGTNWYSGAADNGGVHTNSGVQNFWYYVLVEGDTGTNDFASAYSVPGLGLDKAKDIAFRALSVYLNPFSEYADARDATIAAATDLFGGCSAEVEQVTNAWYAVGLGAAYSSAGGSPVAFSADKTAHCSLPAVVGFAHSTTNVASVLWHFGDGGTSALATPAHTYTAAGSYTVKLVVTRCNGSVDSLSIPAYITIVPGTKFCDTTVLPAGGVVTSSACNGIVVDNGGPGADYAANTSGAVRLEPAGATGLRLRFLSFGTEAAYDFLYLYDGASATAPLIGVYDSTDLPAAGSYITLSGPSAYIRFTSDTYVEESGFVIEYECTLPAPVPAFAAGDAYDCDGVVSFSNSTSPADPANTFAWNFGDGGTSTDFAPTHAYTTPGTYTVTLIACSGAGFCDTVTMPAYVTAVVLIPTATVPDTVAVGVPFSVSAAAAAAAAFEWFVDGGSAVSGAPASLTCSVPGPHEVMLVAAAGLCTDTVRTSVWAKGSVTGISDRSDGALHVFPNPATDVVKVVTPLSWRDVHYTLRSAAGQVVSEGDRKNSQTIEIPVRGLPSGVYLLSVHSALDVRTVRVAVRRQ